MVQYNSKACSFYTIQGNFNIFFNAFDTLSRASLHEAKSDVIRNTMISKKGPSWNCDEQPKAASDPSI